MELSTSDIDWARRREIVNAAYGGEVPSFWLDEIIKSGFMTEVTDRFTPHPFSRP
ncbi:MAG: hypothetical protein WDZ94_04625 [Patescibacteria group bacterium]